MKTIFTLLAGFLIGIASAMAIYLFGSGETDVWISQVDLNTTSGIVFPAGTEFVVTKYMPEGFVALSLGVNVEADELSAFKKITVNKSNLRIPVWLQKSN